MNGRIRLRVADLCYERGLVSRTGRSPGKPHVSALVARTGLPTKVVQKIVRRPHELDMLSFRTVERLCYALECEPGELFGWDHGLPPRPKARPRPANTPPARDRAQRWQAQWDRDHPNAPQPAVSPPASPVLPDWDDEDEDYVRPDELRRLGDAAPTTRASALRKPAAKGPAPAERQAAVPGSEPPGQPMPPRQVGLYELI